MITVGWRKVKQMANITACKYLGKGWWQELWKRTLWCSPWILSCYQFLYFALKLEGRYKSWVRVETQSNGRLLILSIYCRLYSTYWFMLKKKTICAKSLRFVQGNVASVQSAQSFLYIPYFSKWICNFFKFPTRKFQFHALRTFSGEIPSPPLYRAFVCPFNNVFGKKRSQTLEINTARLSRFPIKTEKNKARYTPLLSVSLDPVK